MSTAIKVERKEKMMSSKYWFLPAAVLVLCLGDMPNTATAQTQTECNESDMTPTCQNLAARFITLVEFPLRRFQGTDEGTTWRMSDSETGQTTCRIADRDVQFGNSHQMAVRCQSNVRSEVWIFNQETFHPEQLLIANGVVHAVSFR